MPADLIGGFAGPMLLEQRGIGMVAPFDSALDRELWRRAPDNVASPAVRRPSTL